MVYNFYLYHSINPKWDYYKKQAQRANELGIAIPNTGRKAGYHRRIHKFKASLIQHEIEGEDLKEYGIKISTPKEDLVPTSWDDYVSRSDWNTKNWKKQRKTQWRLK